MGGKSCQSWIIDLFKGLLPVCSTKRLKNPVQLCSIKGLQGSAIVYSWYHATKYVESGAADNYADNLIF